MRSNGNKEEGRLIMKKKTKMKKKIERHVVVRVFEGALWLKLETNVTNVSC